MGSKPNRDAGNPRLVYWIRRQESDLRGLRSERSWDASNPHLNDWRASKELHPTSGLWRPVPRYEDRPKLAERGETDSHAASGTVCFPDSPRTLPGSRSKSAEGGRSRSTHPEGATRFRSEGAPRALLLPMSAEAERIERSRPLRVIAGLKPVEHATCEPLCWRRADHSKAMPHDGTHRLATACRTLPASLSGIGARLRTCTSLLPRTRRTHRYLCVTGKLWAAQESHLDHSA